MKNRGISDDYLRSKLARKGVIRPPKDDHQTVFSLGSSIEKDLGFTENPAAIALGAEIAGKRFNNNVMMLNGKNAGPGMKGVLNARLSALHLTIANCGLTNTYFFFKKNWPHLCNHNGKSAKDEKFLKQLIENIIVKLCCPDPVSLMAERFVAHISRCLMPRFQTVTVALSPARKVVKIEVPWISCVFHRGRVKDIFILESGVPICSGCRTRLVNAYHKKVIVKGASEEKIKLWLGAQAMGDED